MTPADQIVKLSILIAQGFREPDLRGVSIYEIGKRAKHDRSRPVDLEGCVTVSYEFATTRHLTSTCYVKLADVDVIRLLGMED